MFCRQCGNQVSDNAKFCPACGVEIKGEFVSEITKAEKKSREVVKEFRAKSSTGLVVLGVLAIILGFFIYTMAEPHINSKAWYMSDGEKMMYSILGWILILCGGLYFYQSFLRKKCKAIIYRDRIWVQTMSDFMSKAFELDINEIEQIYSVSMIKAGKIVVLVSKGVKYEVIGIAEIDEMMEVLQSLKECI